MSCFVLNSSHSFHQEMQYYNYNNLFNCPSVLPKIKQNQEGILSAVITQCIGNARLNTGHSHVADSILMFGFHQHSNLNVPQSLHCDLQTRTTDSEEPAVIISVLTLYKNSHVFLHLQFYHLKHIISTFSSYSLHVFGRYEQA